jgi:hypothetical protein
MRCLALSLCLWLAASAAALADDAVRILKVLPHFLDQKGRHALNPSLYERDAYQAKLRQNPKLRSGLRFDVQWKGGAKRPLKLRIEMRGGKDDQITRRTLEAPAERHGWFSNWSEAKLTGDDYQKFGEMVAWRVTLWDGDQQVAVEKSFLWQD